jgi:hypothetical protein
MAPPGMSRSPATSAEQPSGHHSATNHWDVGGGILGFPPSRPVTGMSPMPASRPADPPTDLHQSFPRASPLSKLEFPKFDGENPRLWKDRCELYFEVYSVSDALKPRFAALNFTGPAAAWLQTLELRGHVQSWESLHTAVCTRFDRDQYQLHIKQLDNLKQTGSVANYHAKFEQLAHSILLYNNAYDDVYFVTRFLGGLKEEIRAPIALHHPQNLDTASALALLHEEEVEAARRKPVIKSEHKDIVRTGSRVFTTGYRRRSYHKKDDAKLSEKHPPNEKWAKIKASRKAQDLCYTFVFAQPKLGYLDHIIVSLISTRIGPTTDPDLDTRPDRGRTANPMAGGPPSRSAIIKER